MRKDIHNLWGTIRLIAFVLLIAAFVVFCITDNGVEEEEAEPTAAIFPQAQPMHIMRVSAAAPEAEPVEPSEPIEPSEPEAVQPEWISYGTYTLTAYCSCEKCCGYWATIRPLDANGNPIVYTSTGEIAKAGTTIAVDPRVIPYGSEVKINDHIYIAQDTGGAIKGNRIDVYFDSHQAALEFGCQNAEVFLRNE